MHLIYVKKSPFFLKTNLIKTSGYISELVLVTHMFIRTKPIDVITRTLLSYDSYPQSYLATSSLFLILHCSSNSLFVDYDF